MKRIICSICIGTLALAFAAAQGEEINKQSNRTKGARKASTVQKTTAPKASGRVNAQRSVTNVRFRQRTHNATRRTTSRAVLRENQLQTSRVHSRQAQAVRNTNEVRARNDLTVKRERNVAVNRNRNVTLNRERNLTVNNNWRSGRFAGQQYAAFRNYHRQWHDQDWWRSHYSRVIFVSGGWWAWNAGYWYPAWGYDRGYYYPYDGPIYGYNDLTPDQVVVNVQAQLLRDGYYAGPVDGVLGPMTREAIAAFQADHGLAVTSAVDEPTLATLGLV